MAEVAKPSRCCRFPALWSGGGIICCEEISSRTLDCSRKAGTVYGPSPPHPLSCQTARLQHRCSLPTSKGGFRTSAAFPHGAASSRGCGMAWVSAVLPNQSRLNPMRGLYRVANKQREAARAGRMPFTDREEPEDRLRHRRCSPGEQEVLRARDGP